MGKEINLLKHYPVSNRPVEERGELVTERDKDIPKLADIYNKGLLPLEALVTKKYSLDNINQALNDLEDFKVFRPIISF
tara:strand:- start:1775 stop:2011 length:237 start_codon:yes stop_codon:yes gene_type:complete